MSLITRCPACETMFKVVPDQLRISEGWVRCGQCGEIFNASQSLLGDPAPAPAPAAVAARATAPVPAAAPPAPPAPAPSHPFTVDPRPSPPAAPAGPGAPPAFEQKVWDLAPSAEELLPEANPLPAMPPPMAAMTAPPPQAPPVPAPQAVAAPVQPVEPIEPVWRDAPPPPPSPVVDTADTFAAEAGRAAAAAAWPDTDLRTPASDDPPDLPARPSFMEAAHAGRFWHRRPVRLALGTLALLLTGLLLAQVLVQERNRLVLLEPSTRPVLLALCQVAGCAIGPLRQIESIVIDNSSFGRLRADAYRLSFGLRNQAPIDVAMPAIELSLTDTQDQALIRRVILPAEYGAQSPVLAAGADWSGALAMSIRPGAATERISGYRLLAFYP